MLNKLAILILIFVQTTLTSFGNIKGKVIDDDKVLIECQKGLEIVKEVGYIPLWEAN